MSEVLNTIYRQLGGNRFRVMTGGKMMVSTENGIRMRIGRNKTNFELHGSQSEQS